MTDPTHFHNFAPADADRASRWLRNRAATIAERTQS